MSMQEINNKNIELAITVKWNIDYINIFGKKEYYYSYDGIVIYNNIIFTDYETLYRFIYYKLIKL